MCLTLQPNMNSSQDCPHPNEGIAGTLGKEGTEGIGGIAGIGGMGGMDVTGNIGPP